MTRRRTIFIAAAALFLAIAVAALDDAGLRRECRGILLHRVQGRLRQLLQEEPGPVEVLRPAAALSRELHQEQALANRRIHFSP